jgi:uridine kinase
MLKLANYGTVEVPGFDFKTQDRVPGSRLERKKGEMILFEGIHALNPEVTGYEDISSCIYVSVRTRIQLSNGELFHPELIRLMRRIIRDRNFRNRLPSETMDMFDSVQRGENLYINPYKSRAHFQMDTYQGYESSVYANILSDDFAQLDSKYMRFYPICNLIKDLSGISAEHVPESSMIREFIGDSSYKY